MAYSRCTRSYASPGGRLLRCQVFGRSWRLAPLWAVIAFPLLLTGLVGCTPHENGTVTNLPNPVFIPRETPRPPPPPPPPPPLKSITDRTIVIDAGHGGKDPGAMPKYRGGMQEKDINLSIASQLGDQLKARGARVIMTRGGDSFLELDDRARIADRYNADLFVSIHADSSPKRYISGTGIHIHTQASLTTMRIAQCIAASFRRNGISCRGIFRSNFAVLREHNQPGTLIECGYLTNTQDAQRLNDPAYRSKLASAVAEGVVDHFAR
jgi:N-acetylmuramoyl-L-alanine amidase